MSGTTKDGEPRADTNLMKYGACMVLGLFTVFMGEAFDVTWVAYGGAIAAVIGLVGFASASRQKTTTSN